MTKSSFLSEFGNDHLWRFSEKSSNLGSGGFFPNSYILHKMLSFSKKKCSNGQSNLILPKEECVKMINVLQVIIQTRNKEGWADPSPIFKFSTRPKSREKPFISSPHPDTSNCQSLTILNPHNFRLLPPRDAVAGPEPPQRLPLLLLLLQPTLPSPPPPLQVFPLSWLLIWSTPRARRDVIFKKGATTELVS